MAPGAAGARFQSGAARAHPAIHGPHAPLRARADAGAWRRSARFARSRSDPGGARSEGSRRRLRRTPPEHAERQRDDRRLAREARPIVSATLARNHMVRAAAMLLAVTWLFSSSPACPSPSRAAPAGLWVSDQSFGHPARGPLTITMNGRRGRAEIDGRVAAFEIAGDSIRFALPDSSGSFRGRFERVDRAIRGFWIRPAIVEGLTHASDDRGGLFDQAMATPMWLARIGAGCYRGLVVPLEARFTLYLFIWSDSANAWRAAFRNPQFNATGGASRFRMSIDGDSLRFVASFSDRPERRLAAFWDRAHSRICVRWDGIDAPLTLRPGEPADSAGFWPRTPRGRTFAYHAPSAGNDGWSTARASSVGMDERALARLTEALADTNPVAPRAPLVHSCLVERHGRLVYEEYFFGFDRDQTHDLRSAGKTFASVMLGAAMHAGLPIAPESSVYSLMAGRGPFANPDA